MDGTLGMWDLLRSDTTLAKVGCFVNMLSMCYYIYMKLTKTKLTALVFLIVSITIIGFLSTVNYKTRIILGGKVLSVDVADNIYTQAKGLSYRKSMSVNEGMFFIFKDIDKHGFWMKDMNFSIDIIWLDENMKINHIERSLGPETFPKIFYPEAPGKYVLEISAGQSNILKIKIGDMVNFLDKKSN